MRPGNISPPGVVPFVRQLRIHPPPSFSLRALLLYVLIVSFSQTSSSWHAMGTVTTSPRVARAAVAQLRSTRDKRSNLMNIARCAGWAKRGGAQILFLPECLGFMGDDAEHTLNQSDPPIVTAAKRRCETPPPPQNPFRRALADTISSHARMPCGDGNTDADVKIGKTQEGDEDDGGEEAIASIVEELRFIARESKLWISGGGVHTAVPPSDDNAIASNAPSRDDGRKKKVYNTHVVIDGEGHIEAHYHKAHLFDVSIPGIELRESRTTAPGRRSVVCDSPVGKMGLTICYDLRFGEMYVDLVRKGAEVLLVPSAFTVPTGRAHWHALLRARAIESQCYVVAAAQVGRHNEKRQSYGHSVVYDPWGNLVADAGGYDGKGSSGIVESQEEGLSPVRVPSIIMAEIDLDRLASVRERMPIQQHRDISAYVYRGND